MGRSRLSIIVSMFTLVFALLSACASQPPAALRGTGDLGVVIERATGQLQVVETTGRSALAQVSGLGDLSHASVVFSRDSRYAYVFGRDGGLTKVDLLRAEIVGRVLQAVRSQLAEDAEPPFSTRKTAGERHVSVTIEPTLDSADHVLAIYRELSDLEGLVLML